MYTLVFKWKDDTMVVFDVFHTKRGKQRIIGNIFCRKEENGRYKAYSLMTCAFVTPARMPDPMLKLPVEKLREKAEDICNKAEYICNVEWFNK